MKMPIRKMLNLKDYPTLEDYMKATVNKEDLEVVMIDPLEIKEVAKVPNRNFRIKGVLPIITELLDKRNKCENVSEVTTFSDTRSLVIMNNGEGYYVADPRHMVLGFVGFAYTEKMKNAGDGVPKSDEVDEVKPIIDFETMNKMYVENRKNKYIELINRIDKNILLSVKAINKDVLITASNAKVLFNLDPAKISIPTRIFEIFAEEIKKHYADKGLVITSEGDWIRISWK